MRISLLYHDDAGDGISVRLLRETIEKAGHAIEHTIKETPHLERVLEGSTELLVAAGGDGTVRRAVQALVGTGIPLAILPLGTANNIAKSLGIEGSIPQLVRAWDTARPRPFDVGVVQNGGNQTRFLEGVGSGLIPAAIAAVKAHADDENDESTARLHRAVRRYHTVLSRLEPRHWRATLDDSRIEGQFVLLEALNTPSVGPNLVLSDEADPSDGFLSVVAVLDEDRVRLADYLRCRIERRECDVAFPTRRARRIVIEGWHEMHIDGEVHRWSDGEPVSIRIEAAAVQVLSGAPR